MILDIGNLLRTCWKTVAEKAAENAENLYQLQTTNSRVNWPAFVPIQKTPTNVIKLNIYKPYPVYVKLIISDVVPSLLLCNYFLVFTTLVLFSVKQQGSVFDTL